MEKASVVGLAAGGASWPSSSSMWCDIAVMVMSFLWEVAFLPRRDYTAFSSPGQ